MYVTDNYRIQKLSSDGTYLAQWGTGTYGSNPGQFESPEGIAVDSSGNVYVADTGNYRIQKLSSDGTYLAQWGIPGSYNEISLPIGVTVDSSGNVYVTEDNNNQIVKFSSDGTCLAQWGTSGSNPGQFESPGGIAVDTAGNVYVVDSGNNRIQVYAQGNFTMVAGFTANVTYGSAPLTVQFNDTSTGSPTSWNWSFGDDNFSTLQNATHTYISVGSYTVSLNATNAGGSNLSVLTNYITVHVPAPLPDFVANITSGTAPLPVGSLTYLPTVYRLGLVLRR